MYKARMLRADAVEVYPTISAPLKGRPVTMIAYRDKGGIADATGFQWAKQDKDGDPWNPINGAIYSTYQIDSADVASIGKYKCSVKFIDGTTSDTNEIAVSMPTEIPIGSNENKFHNAPKIYQGPWVYTHVHWKDIDKIKKIMSDSTNSTPLAVQIKLLVDPSLVYVYDLINRYGYVKMRDSRNGYTYSITEKSKYPDGLVLEGQFKNYWPAP